MKRVISAALAALVLSGCGTTVTTAIPPKSAAADPAYVAESRNACPKMTDAGKHLTYAKVVSLHKDGCVDSTGQGWQGLWGGYCPDGRAFVYWSNDSATAPDKIYVAASKSAGGTVQTAKGVNGDAAYQALSNQCTFSAP